MQLHGFFFVLIFVSLGLFSDFYRNFAPNRSRDTLVGDVQQKINTPYCIDLWHRQNTRFEGNVLSVVRCSKFAPLMQYIVRNNVPMLHTRGRKTERQKKPSMKSWQKKFLTYENIFRSRKRLLYIVLNETLCIVRFVRVRYLLSTLEQSN